MDVYGLRQCREFGQETIQLNWGQSDHIHMLRPP